jgi:hypothetical protein
VAGPYAVVMAPTRELAQQIEDETVKFAHFLVCRVLSYTSLPIIMSEASGPSYWFGLVQWRTAFGILWAKRVQTFDARLLAGFEVVLVYFVGHSCGVNRGRAIH